MKHNNGIGDGKEFGNKSWAATELDSSGWNHSVRRVEVKGKVVSS